MADDAPVASSPLSIIQTPPDSPQDTTELQTPVFAGNALHLRLKTLDERVFDVEAASSMSVADFRAKVALATAVPASRQRLIYRGKLLKDGAALATYDLQDGHTVHLVAKPPASTLATTSTTQTHARPREVNGPAWNLVNLRSALRRTAATTTASPPLPLLREILGNAAETPQETTDGMGLSSSDGSRHESAILDVDLEPMTQGILTMRTVLSTAMSEREGQSEQQLDESNERVEQQSQIEITSRRSRRQFFVGQWLDVKDTVNQWLESTVMAIADGKVLIHYHGWPTRWDEWIEVDSDRISTFRTRTLHPRNGPQMSPTPTTRVPSAPRVGDNDVRQLIINVRNVMGEMMPHIDRLAELCEEDLRQNLVDSVSSAEITLGARDSEVSEVAHLVAPLFDRFGRLLMDSAGHFDPLLRPELQGSSQRQRDRHTATLRRENGESTQLPTATESTSLDVQDNALLVRDLIASSPNTASELTQPRRSIDVHIHAIVAPASLSSFASLAGSSNNTSNSDEGARQRNLTPSTSTIGRSPSSLEDIRTIEDETDHSRVPLLGAYRHSESSQQRAVAQDLDNFLSNDFFESPFRRNDGENDSDDESNQSDATPGSRLGYRPPSPSRQIVSPRTPRSGNSPRLSSDTIGVIPEVAAAEERLRAVEESYIRGSDHDHGSVNGRTSSASAESSTSSSLGLPTFLEVMRRTLSGVRNFVHNEGSNSSPLDASTRGPSFSLPFGSDSPVSISSSSGLSTPPVSPFVRSSIRHSLSSPSDSSIDEELDLDEVD